MQIILENNTTHFQQYYDDVDVENGEIFCKTILDVSSLDNGEYTLYLLNNANEVIEKELLRIGDYNNNGYKIKNNFIQYGRK